MSLDELKEEFEKQRGLKIRGLKKAEIVSLLESEQCDPLNNSFCSDSREFCNLKYNRCVKDKGEKLLEIVVNGHKIIGSASAINEIRKKLHSSPKVKSPPRAKSPPPKVKSPNRSAPIENVLENITRPEATTQEYRQNLERLKKCLGLIA